jgi:hypothetical protein
MPDAVNRFCDERRNWHSMRGFARKDLPRPGPHCIVTQFVFAKRTGTGAAWRHWHDSDAHKRFVHEGFRVSPGHPGELSLFGSLPTAHREFADHICAEVYEEHGPDDYRWVHAGGPNHWLDATALCYAGASRRSLTVFDGYATTTHAQEVDYPTATETQSKPDKPSFPERPVRRARVRAAETLDL